MSQNTPPTEADRAVARLFGALLMAVGGLIVVLCGLCSLGFLVITIGAGGASAQASQLPGFIMMVAVIGGVPIGVGVVVFIVGRSLWRRPRPRA